MDAERGAAPLRAAGGRGASTLDAACVASESPQRRVDLAGDDAKPRHRTGVCQVQRQQPTERRLRFHVLQELQLQGMRLLVLLQLPHLRLREL